MYEQLQALPLELVLEVPPVFVQGGTYLLCAVALVYLRARLVEFIRCRRRMRVFIQQDPSNWFMFVLTAAQQLMWISKVNATATTFISQMGTTRSRWIVLRLACLSVKETPVTRFYFNLTFSQDPQFVHGLARLRAFWEAADI